jgi:tripartite-type tricarboxylate transporter receptor subunit TctC
MQVDTDAVLSGPDDPARKRRSDDASGGVRSAADAEAAVPLDWFADRRLNMTGTRARLSVGGRLGTLATLLLLPISLAACGSDQGGTTTGASGGGDDAACDDYPSEDITLLVPYSAGGGFDAWARLLAPFIEENLGGEASVRVENQPGGGGMRAVNTLYAAEPDGTTLLFTEPGYITVNQILGNVNEGFDANNLTWLGRTTADPQVFVVSADSDVETIEDLAAGGPIVHAGQDISPIETITYDAFGVEADYVLHEGTSDVILAVRRGDSDVTVASLSSLLSFIESGEVKPILFLGTEEITPDLLGYEHLKDVQTASDAGEPDLGEVLEQQRMLVTAPETPECIADKLAQALADTLADEEFRQKAEASDLRVVPGTADEATEFVSNTLTTFEKYRDVLEQATS